MHKIFHESPSRRADYEKVSLATKEDYPLLFCATRRVENQFVAKNGQSIWPKFVAVVDFWSTLSKSRQPGGGDPKANKSYQVLLSKCKNQLITVKFQFFEEIAEKMKMIGYMCSEFILNDVLEKAKTTSLIKLSIIDRNILKVTKKVSFGLKSYLKDKKKSLKNLKYIYFCKK